MSSGVRAVDQLLVTCHSDAYFLQHHGRRSTSAVAVSEKKEAFVGNSEVLVVPDAFQYFIAMINRGSVPDLLVALRVVPVCRRHMS